MKRGNETKDHFFSMVILSLIHELEGQNNIETNSCLFISYLYDVKIQIFT